MLFFDETVMLHDLPSKESPETTQQKLSAHVEFEISGSILESVAKSSSEMQGDAVSSPSPVPP